MMSVKIWRRSLQTCANLSAFYSRYSDRISNNMHVLYSNSRFIFEGGAIRGGDFGTTRRLKQAGIHHGS
jgi:hypothetical protein